MAISINEITSGTGLKVDGNIFIVESYNHVKPGKGSAFVRVRMRNIKTDQVLERTFKSAESLDDVPLEERRMQFTYQSGDQYHFMDMTSFEEVAIPEPLIGESAHFLQENLEVVGVCQDMKVLKVILPNFVVFQITRAETGLKGDSSKAGTKPVEIDTGATINVPLFINEGDYVKVDTRNGQYVERVKK